MSNFRERLDRASASYRLPPDAWPRVERRVAARRRTRRLATIASALVVGVGAIAVVLTAFSSTLKPPIAPVSPSPGAVDVHPGLIVYVSRTELIFTMKANGTDKQQLTTKAQTPAAPFPALDPAWSPNSKQIAFRGYYGGHEGTYGLYLMNADGTGVVRVPRGYGYTGPAWSPDGTRIAVDGISLINTDGSHRVQLTKNGYEPTWSPDGAQIAYSAPAAHRTSQIFTMRANGSDARQLTSLPTSAFEPAWSPDGREIAFSVEVGNHGSALDVMDSDGSHIRQLSACAAPPCYVGSPSWSPDGSLILYSCNNDLCTVRPDGTGLTQITHDHAGYSEPQWQPRVTPIQVPSTVTPSPSVSATNPVAPGFRPDAIAFWDSSHGLMTGLQRCASCEGAVPGGLVAATDDGGRTWRVVDRTTPTTGVATFGADDAWVMTATGVLHTADGGHTWNKISSANLVDPSFSSPLDGWAAVRVSDVHYRLEETSDGGRTWQKIPSPCDRAIIGISRSGLSPTVPFLYDLSNTAPGQGSVLCSNGGTMGGVAQGVFLTQDHGVTWTQRWAGYDNLYGMQILPDGYGGRWNLVSGGYETTTDGGSTWTTVGKFTDPATESAWLLSDSSAFALTGSGHGYSLVQTTDGGHTWRHVVRFPVD